MMEIVGVALSTGMRRGEILGLKWRDFDFKRRIITLLDTKNGQKREVPMSETVNNAILQIHEHPDSPYVFCNQQGKLRADIRQSFSTALKKSDITNLHFHDLRHTFASQLVMSGVDLNTVRELLGHKTITMTLRYSHLSPNHKKEAVETLNETIDTNTGTNRILDVEVEFNNIVSSLNSNKMQDNAGLAQLVEQLICKRI